MWAASPRAWAWWTARENAWVRSFAIPPKRACAQAEGFGSLTSYFRLTSVVAPKKSIHLISAPKVQVSRLGMSRLRPRAGPCLLMTPLLLYHALQKFGSVGEIPVT
jgi:hypothetical protein